MKFNREKKKNYILLFLLLMGMTPLMAEKPEEWDGLNYISRELADNKGSTLSLLPDCDQAEYIKRGLENFDPSGTVEILFRMPRPEGSEGLDLKPYILGALGRVSTLEGIEYFSGSQQAMAPYLTEAYRVAKIKSTKKIDDPTISDLKKTPTTIQIYQKDTKFGKTWYDATYTLSDDAVRLSMINRTAMHYLIFSIMKKEGLHIELLAIPKENEILLYTMASYKLGNTFGMDISLDESFDHRISALQVWFVRQFYGIE